MNSSFFSALNLIRRPPRPENVDITLKISRFRHALVCAYGFPRANDWRAESLALKLRDVKTEVIRETDGSYAVVCSALGVYSVGKTLIQAKRNFEEALDLHLPVLREKGTKQIATVDV